MKALISPIEIVDTETEDIKAFRIVQVRSESFDVAPPLYWIDCPDDCVADIWCYNEELDIFYMTKTYMTIENSTQDANTISTT